MKSLLKLIGACALTLTPVVTVVACGSEEKKLSDEDIRNKAVALITNSDISMVRDLKLPDTTDLDVMKDKKFNDLDNNVQSAISTFFSTKLKKSTDQVPTNWYYDDAKVVISTFTDPDFKKDKKAKFELPVGKDVNGHMMLKAEISYKNLPPITKNIKLTINNDISIDQKKADAIQKFVKNEIETNKLNVNVESLPQSGAFNSGNLNIDRDNASANAELRRIGQSLNEKIVEMVDYSKLSLNFNFNKFIVADSDAKKTLFTMTPPTLNVGDKSVIFNGTIDNVTITFLVGTAGEGVSTLDTTTISGGKISINQNFVDATEQIRKVFNGWIIDIKSAALPKPDQTFDMYNSGYPNLKDEFIGDGTSKPGFFTNIQKVYSNVGTGWDKTIITIIDEKVLFNFDGSGQSGYFNLNFNLKYDFSTIVSDSISKFDINVENVKIQLNKMLKYYLK